MALFTVDDQLDELSANEEIYSDCPVEMSTPRKGKGKGNT